MQCLHCATNVCLECAQKHAELIANENHTITDLINEKLDVLDRIAENTRRKIRIEREKMIQGIDIEYDRSLMAFSELIENEKQQLRDKNKQLTELSFNELPTFVKNLKTELQSLIDDNNGFFTINTTMPRIEIQRASQPISIKYSPPEKKESISISRKSESDDCDDLFYGDSLWD